MNQINNLRKTGYGEELRRFRRLATNRGEKCEMGGNDILGGSGSPDGTPCSRKTQEQMPPLVRTRAGSRSPIGTGASHV